MSNKSVLLLVLTLTQIATGASACIAPDRPWLPSDPQDMREFVDLLQADYERYLSDVQEYLRCLDQERLRVFDEAREVTNEYGRFLDLTRSERERRSGH